MTDRFDGWRLKSSNLDWRGQRFHLLFFAAFSLLLIPACFMTRLSFPSPFSNGSFLFSWAVQSILWAALLYQFGTACSWAPLFKNAWRLLPALGMAALIFYLFGWSAGAEITVVAFAIAEFHFRGGSWKTVAGAVVPWLYLASGIIVALFYSSVVVSVRPCSEYDAVLKRLDSWILFGGSVTAFSDVASRLYSPAELIYYGIGGVMGAAILFLCLAGDRRSALQMCGSIVTAYFLSILIFYCIPAQGPFIASALPPQLITAGIQRMSLLNATALYHHAQWLEPPLAYYVAFPSLHVAQPLIAAWFLRRWKGVSTILYAYCSLLVVAILILRWHYVVDILGGLGVAASAVALVTLRSRPRPAPLSTGANVTAPHDQAVAC